MKHARSLGRTSTASIGRRRRGHERVGPVVHRGTASIDRVGRADDDAPLRARASPRRRSRRRATRSRPARRTTLGAGVGELVPQELALVRGVDRHLDRAELQRREERDDLLGPFSSRSRRGRRARRRAGERVRRAASASSSIRRAEYGVAHRSRGTGRRDRMRRARRAPR